MTSTGAATYWTTWTTQPRFLDGVRDAGLDNTLDMVRDRVWIAHDTVHVVHVAGDGNTMLNNLPNRAWNFTAPDNLCVVGLLIYALDGVGDTGLANTLVMAGGGKVHDTAHVVGIADFLGNRAPSGPVLEGDRDWHSKTRSVIRY